MAVNEKRREELQSLLARAFEELPAIEYEWISKPYKAELAGLALRAERWEKQLTAFAGIISEAEFPDVTDFSKRLSEYDSFDEITPEILSDFVDLILVYEREEKRKQYTPQKIDVYLK